MTENRQIVRGLNRQSMELTDISTVRLSVGSAADSAHEYTLKQFLLTARSDGANLEMC